MVILIWIFCILQVCLCHYTLLLNTHKDVRLLRGSKKPQIIVKDLSEGVAIDYFYKESLVCWADHGTEHHLEEIACSSYNVTTHKTTLAKYGGLSYPEGVAVDWLTKKVYWTDRGDSHSDMPAKIEVVSLETKYRKILFSTELELPRGIAVDPLLGTLFWSDWGEEPKIQSASMNGDPTSRRIIVIKDLFWPNGISLDITTKEIYWVDGKLMKLEVSDYKGYNRRLLLEKVHLPYPFGLSIAEDKIFWTDWNELSLYVTDRKLPTTPLEIVHLQDPPISDVKVLDSRRQPYEWTPCEHNNGNCSHLCLLSSGPERYSCACPTGIRLLNDNVTCADFEERFLLLAQWSEISKISLDTPDVARIPIPVKDNVKHAMGIDYDPVEKYFYWTDQQLRSVRRARLDGSKSETVVSQDVFDPDGIAIDWMARNLYWCDTGANRIEMMRLKTRYRKTIIYNNLEEPRAVVVAPQNGWLYWSDWDEGEPKIERSDLDGTNRLIIVGTGISWPNGLALDVAEGKLYWGDAKTDKIEVVDMEGGGNRKEIIGDNIPHIFGLSLLEDKLYWTDVQRRAVECASKKGNGYDRQQLLDVGDLRGIKAVNVNAKLGANSCSMNNGGCEQFCIHKPDNRSVCVCQFDYELRPDNRSCALSNVSLILYSPKGISKVSVTNARIIEPVPINNIRFISAIDLNLADTRIYWAETNSKQRLMVINRAFVNGSRLEKLAEFDVESPESLAVDWLSTNIYWADTGTRRIEVAKLSGQFRRVLFWRGLREPRNLLLDPRVGLMFWSEWGGGNGNGAIVRANMDGSTKESIVSNIGRVNGLTIDYVDRFLYWTSDANGDGVIERCDLDGRNRRLVLTSPTIQPYSIVHHHGSLFWINFGNSSVIQVDKSTGRFEKVVFAQKESVSDLRVVDTSPPKIGWNSCSTSPQKCRYLCLVRPIANSPSMHPGTVVNCSCPSHYTMHDGVCHPPVSYLLFAQRNAVHRLTTNLNDCPDVPLPVTGLKAVRAIDFDPVSKHVYWIDGKASAIKRAQENSSHAQVVVGSNVDVDEEPQQRVYGTAHININVNSNNYNGRDEKYFHFFDIALEPYSKLLFWSCSVTDTINVTRINQQNVAGCIFVATSGEKPRHLALFPERGLLFWVNVGERPGIVQSRLNGQKQSFIETGEQLVVSLAVDRKFNMLYFSCADKLYQYDLFGKSKVVILSYNKRITGLAVMRSYLYWVDKEGQRIERFDRTTTNDAARIVIVEHAQQITDLVAVTPLDDDVDIGHPCSVRNHFGNCTDLCMRSMENPNVAECACTIGLHLNQDQKSCSWVQPCGLNHFTCRSTISECVPRTWRCDGTPDCTDASDEEGCVQCGQNEFQCAPSICVSLSMVCDGVANCPNAADESQNCAEPRLPTGISGGVNDDNPNLLVLLALSVIVFFVVIALVFTRFKGGFKRRPVVTEQDVVAMRPLAPGMCPQMTALGAPHSSLMNGGSVGSCAIGGSPIGGGSGGAGGGSSGSYDRSHITGASSSISVNNVPLNPPPSPTTTILQEEFCCDLYSLHPHPTPCSTFICDDSDMNSSSSYRRAPSLDSGYHHHHHQPRYHHRSGRRQQQHQQKQPYHHGRNRRTPVGDYCSDERAHLPSYLMDRTERSDYELPQPPPTPCSYSSPAPSPTSSLGRSSSPR